METLQFKVRNCEDCPFLELRRHYTADSFEILHDWHCIHKDSNDRVIKSYVEWNDDTSKIVIPDWCPIKVKQTN